MPIHSDLSSIESLVSLISGTSPETSARLEREVPLYGVTLRHGPHYGEGEEETNQRIDIALAGLKIAAESASPNLERLGLRLARAKGIRFIGNLVTTITGGGILGALFTHQKAGVTIAMAVLNLAASLCTQWASYLEAPLYANTGNLVDTFEEISDIASQAQILIGQLEICRKSKCENAYIMERVGRSDELAGKLLIFIKRFGLKAS